MAFRLLALGVPDSVKTEITIACPEHNIMECTGGHSFQWKFTSRARAEIVHVITTIFQPGGRSEISARAKIHHAIRPKVLE